ncbi:mechanosensitive ion channel [Proteiniclasticum sp. SCR006]|uniref:Mechanosensitive ion channel n=1 Tax=Proteiniclasticum aestuarii TaxID=2817862 RepID=A0A939H4C2_9CLOT|nr:mechanosensitive ion channel domain-containing protein [Proteiniclasticum aestuarii]MBO1263957.1 mechanosensitive ion channel [Proteiniclasticum aestuarii]
MDFFEKLNGMIGAYGFKILGFLVVLVIGWQLAKYVVRLLEKSLMKSKLDVSVHGFILTLSGFFLKLIVIITAATIIDVPMTTFIAMLSAAGLAVGLALKDSLSNFAAGILLLIFRPFGVGDYIQTSDVSGTVLSIEMLYTSMNTIDNKRVMVPNGHLATSHITNYSVEPYRRIDKVYSVAYGTDVLKVKEVLMGIVLKNEMILDERGVILGVINHGDSSVDFDLKVWVKREDYFTVLYALNEDVIVEFEKNDIEIPYPTRDVTVTMNKTDSETLEKPLEG